MSKTLYVTTTIPYVNAPPHIGFALELVQADAIARYNRLVGRTVRLQSGTDENAFKNVLSAQARGIPVELLVSENAERFRKLGDLLNIAQDAFVRTTSPEHRIAVHAFLGRLRPDDVYRAAYQGLYCNGCEDFYLERDLVDSNCPEHQTRVTEIEEHNYFFRLSAYQAQLHELIASRRLRVLPEARETEVLRFIERGLADISISRDAARSAGWGIRYPGDNSQVVYVWIDALVNYLTGLGFPGADAERNWHDCEKLHVIGKNVWKFHAVYWPALLLSAGLPVPDTIFTHGFLTIDGEKISKSSGPVIDPAECIAAFGSDAVRYFLLRHIRPTEDTDFTETRLADAYTNDLANGLGNLCSRLTTLCESAELAGISSNGRPGARPRYHEHLAAFRFDRAIETLSAEITVLNRQIGDAEPWREIAAGNLSVVRSRLREWAERLDAVAYWLQPFLPATGARIRSALTTPRIQKCAPLFPRLLSKHRTSGERTHAAPTA
ncbi:MAG: methionine--tRNA ligase [Gemmatimonadota bacterium]